MIAGICGGLAEYFDVDPVIVRLAMVCFGIWGAGVLFYLIAWIIIPEEPYDTTPPGA
jgi:phage shock protein C